MTKEPTIRIQRTGTLAVPRPIEEAFPLFSPLGEKAWIDGWNPVFHWPVSGEWSAGQVFSTTAQGIETIWIVARLDKTAHEVEYHRVTPGLHVAEVVVSCRTHGTNRTEVHIRYTYTALTSDGEAFLGSVTEASFAEMIADWERRIQQYLQGNVKA